MKYALFIGMLTTCMSAASFSQTVPGVPEPGMVLYGKILAADGVTTIPASAVNLHLRVVGGADLPLAAEVISNNETHYYLARIPFESVLAGLQDTASNNLGNSQTTDNSYELQPDSVQFEGTTASSVTPVDNADSSSTVTFGSNDLRGDVFRMDIQTQFQTNNLADYDAWAVEHFGEATGDGASDADPDKDGLTNSQEWFFGTDPTNTESDPRLHRTVLGISPVDEQPAQITIKISPKWNDGRVYTVTKSTDFSDPDSWRVPNPPLTIVDAAPIGTSGAVEAFATDTAATEEAAFYRVEVTFPSQATNE